MAHEIGHAMGLFHEQSRPSRNDYVHILEDNIDQTYISNFDQKLETDVDYHGVPYDFTSDMHYSTYVRAGLHFAEVNFGGLNLAGFITDS